MAIQTYDNFVLENKMTELLNTQANIHALFTIDESLATDAGLKKVVNKYTYSGTVEKLADGAKNTSRGSITYTGKDYTVQRAQQVFDYLDSDFMKDNTVVDNMLKGANQVMVNQMTADFITEAKKATLEQTFVKNGALGYDTIVDAISKLNLENESEIFVVIPNAWKAALRKDEDYKSARMGEVVYNGQVGTICGIPVIATKALTDAAFVMTKEAVKLFMKNDVEVEQDRDIEAKKNTVALTTYYFVALVDDTKICKITEAKA